MTNYSFNILIAANSKVEAEAKLELLLQMGTFCSGFSVPNLATAFLKYKLLNLIGNMPNNKPQGRRQQFTGHN